MSKQKNKSKQVKADTTKANPVSPVTTATPKPFSIPYPVLILLAVVLVLYSPSFHFGFTELDDSIFIKDLHEYNENLANLITSFHRGVFNPTNDTYYRPLFLDSMILNYQWSEQNVMGYHVINVLLHALSVLLLYKLFIKLGTKQVQAFLLALLFAVHPVLSQAVAWIPGRNDTMLAVFTFGFLISAINYAERSKAPWLLLSVFLLLCAFFTKETAVFNAPVAFVLLKLFLKKSWKDKGSLVQYGAWVVCFMVWYGIRATATLKTATINPAQLAHDFTHRCPVVVQYLGKIFFPFNLSVFPIQQDTVYYTGFIVIALLAAIIYFAKQKDMQKVLGGIAVFILFLLPVLFVPNTLNEQTFEHRLYLPMFGILLILPETILLRNRLKDMQMVQAAGGVAIVLGIISFIHQKNFNDPISFWTQAVKTSPHSAYATMMLAARTKDKAASYALMRKAYTMNPNEKYINYYYGSMLQDEDSVLASEKYLLKEKNTSGYYLCDFYLARVAFEKKDLAAASGYLQTYLKADPANEKANNNLLLIYLQTNRPNEARTQVHHMQDIGLSVPPGVLQQLK